MARFSSVQDMNQNRANREAIHAQIDILTQPRCAQRIKVITKVSIVLIHSLRTTAKVCLMTSSWIASNGRPNCILCTVDTYFDVS